MANFNDYRYLPDDLKKDPAFKDSLKEAAGAQLKTLGWGLTSAAALTGAFFTGPGAIVLAPIAVLALYKTIKSAKQETVDMGELEARRNLYFMNKVTEKDGAQQARAAAIQQAYGERSGSTDWAKTVSGQSAGVAKGL